MTDDQFELFLRRLYKTVDGGCCYCSYEVRKLVRDVFPEYDGLAGKLYAEEFGQDKDPYKD